MIMRYIIFIYKQTPFVQKIHEYILFYLFYFLSYYTLIEISITALFKLKQLQFHDHEIVRTPLKYHLKRSQKRLLFILFSFFKLTPRLVVDNIS